MPWMHLAIYRRISDFLSLLPVRLDLRFARISQLLAYIYGLIVNSSSQERNQSILSLFSSYLALAEAIAGYPCGLEFRVTWRSYYPPTLPSHLVSDCSSITSWQDSFHATRSCVSVNQIKHGPFTAKVYSWIWWSRISQVGQTKNKNIKLLQPWYMKLRTQGWQVPLCVRFVMSDCQCDPQSRLSGD